MRKYKSFLGMIRGLLRPKGILYKSNEWGYIPVRLKWTPDGEISQYMGKLGPIKATWIPTYKNFSRKDLRFFRYLYESGTFRP